MSAILPSRDFFVLMWLLCPQLLKSGFCRDRMSVDKTQFVLGARVSFCVKVRPGAEVFRPLKFMVEFCPEQPNVLLMLPIVGDLDFVCRKPAELVQAHRFDVIQD